MSFFCSLVVRSEDRTAGGDQLHTHLVRQDVGEGSLPEARGSAQEQVIERLTATPRCLDEDTKIVLVFGLANVIA
jgi:hypothetical protein